MVDYISEQHVKTSTAYRSLLDELHSIDYTLQAEVPVQLHEDFDRYQVWAANLGAGFRGRDYKRSLDYRLRQTESHKQALLKILRRIESLLQQLSKVLHDVNGSDAESQDLFSTSQTDEQTSEYDHNDGGESAWSLSSAESLDQIVPYSEASRDEPSIPTGRLTFDQLLQQASPISEYSLKLNSLLRSLSFSITSLYKVPVRKPTNTDQAHYLKRRYKVDTTQSEPLDVAFVRELFPRANEQVILRLGRMITRRRQILKTRSQRNQELRFEELNSAPKSKVADRLPYVSMEQIPVLEIPEAGNTEIRQVSSTTESRIKATAFAPVEPPEIDSLTYLESAPSEIAESVSSITSTDTAKDLLVIPSRPSKADGTEKDDFECPFCHTLLHIKGGHQWEKHVLNDLQPYTCTSVNCNVPDLLFSDREAWYNHELQHQSEYGCSDPQHPSFSESASFITHLREQHAVTENIQPHMGVLRMFLKPPKQATKLCPLCFAEPRDMKSHLSRHLQHIALFALPRQDGEVDTEAVWGGPNVPAVAAQQALIDQNNTESTNLSSSNEAVKSSSMEEELGQKLFCHTCAHTWNRDDEGLKCSECESKDVEILEKNTERDSIPFGTENEPPIPRDAILDSSFIHDTGLAIQEQEKPKLDTSNLRLDQDRLQSDVEDVYNSTSDTIYNSSLLRNDPSDPVSFGQPDFSTSELKIDTWNSETSRFDIFPRTDRTFCYICSTPTMTHRTSGDRDQLWLRSQQIADAGFYAISLIDIEPLTCTNPVCRQRFEGLPVSSSLDHHEPCKANFSSEKNSFSHIPQLYDKRLTSKDEVLRYIREECCRDHSKELEALFQDWLFFGLLSECLEGFYERNDYVHTDEKGNQFLSLDRLPTVISKWMHSVTRSGVHAEQFFLRLTHVLETSTEMLRAVMSCDFSDNLRDFLACTAEILAWSLEISFSNGAVNKSFPLYGSRLTLESLTSLGWCPSEAQKASKTVMTLALKALYQSIDRRERQLDHQNCGLRFCSMSSDHGYPVEIGHQRDCIKPECDYVGLDEISMQNLCSILEAGSYPLLSIERSPDGSILLQVVPYSEGLPYIAISHVWSQGLGNDYDNSLIKCRLERLILHMTHLWSLLDPQHQKPLLFWLDTFCCPRASRANRIFGNYAIQRMPKIIQSAEAVLVIDSELENLNIVDYSPVEVACRVLLSSWASRLWTMLDGSLPEELFFQFQGSTLNAHSIFLSLRAVLRGPDVRERILAVEMLSRFDRLRMLCGRYLTASTEQTLDLVVNEMQTRVVSVARDEAVCISMLLKLDSSQVLRYEGHEERMRNIWMQISDRRLLPQACAFTYGPKLQLKGFRWANSTFLENAGIKGLGYSSSSKGYATDEGIMIEADATVFMMAAAYKGLDIDPYGGSLLAGHEIFALKTTEDRYQRFFALDKMMEKYFGAPITEHPNLFDHLNRQRGTLAFLKKDLTSYSSSRDERTCLLVEIQKREGKSIYCKRLRVGVLHSVPEKEEATIALAVRKAESLRDHHLIQQLGEVADLPDSAETRHRRLQIHKDLQPLLLHDKEALLGHDSVPEDIKDMVPDVTYPLHIVKALAGQYGIAIENVSEQTQWYID